MIKIEMLTGDDEAANNLEEEGRDGEEARRVITPNLFTPLLGSSPLCLSLIITTIYHGMVNICFP